MPICITVEYKGSASRVIPIKVKYLIDTQILSTLVICNLKLTFNIAER
jgi:hypothetical protein